MHPIFHTNKYLLPSLIVLLAAVILAAALVATRPVGRPASNFAAAPQMGASADAAAATTSNNLVPATADTPAHLKTPEGEANPAAALSHYAGYAPTPFTISAVGSNSITGSFNGGAAQTLAVTSQTEIYAKGAQKGSAEFQKEMAEFQQKMQYADTNDIYVAPDPYEHTPLSLSDLHTGELVIVASADGKTADTIFVQGQ